MERPNAWKTYNKTELKKLEDTAKEYRTFLDAGKTERECVLLTVDALEKAGYTVGLIGTNGIHYGNFHQETENSTPESYEIHYHLNEMIKTLAEYPQERIERYYLQFGRKCGIIVNK